MDRKRPPSANVLRRENFPRHHQKIDQKETWSGKVSWKECFLRLPQITGQQKITRDQAEDNRRNGKYPRTPRPHIDPIIPVSRSGWWAGVKSGKYPKPIKLGERTTVWKASEVLALIDAAGGGLYDQ